MFKNSSKYRRGRTVRVFDATLDLSRNGYSNFSYHPSRPDHILLWAM